MEKNNLLAGFGFILFLIQSPLALAISCEFSPANYDLCIDILNSGITSQEKEILISNLDYQSKFFPDHEYIFNKNLEIEINFPPEGIQTYNKEFIKNAWVEIFASMPSVLYKERLYVPSKTSLLTGFNYDLQIPKNYYSSKYPQTEKGYCKIIYSLNGREGKNRIYINKEYAGEGDLFDLILNKNSTITSEYEIKIRVEIDYHKWRRYCSSRRDDGTCRRYSYSCDYSKTEYKQESLKIKDDLNVSLYQSNLFSFLEPVDSYGGIAKFKLNYSNSINLNFKDSEYAFNKYFYSVDYSFPPYYVSTLKAEDYSQEKISNLLKDREFLIVKNTENCKIKSFDFFKSVEKGCNSEYGSIDFFIKTDKLKYEIGETIKVNIFPKNVTTKITYNGETKTQKGSAEFIAQSYQNKISAEYNDFKAETIIYISNKERIFLICNLAVFVFLNCFLYVLLKYCSKKIKCEK